MVRILLVDDDDAFRTMLEKTLARAGYEVDTAPNGKVALERFAANPSNLVITDLVMPQKEGIETILELRGRYPGLKIIAISGGGRGSPQSWLNMAACLGASETLAKPFSNQEILDAVERAVAV